MGYNTRYTGTLKFKHELSVPQYARLNAVLGEDPCELGLTTDRNTGYIDLALTKDLSALQWNDAEKTYHLEKSVNLLVEHMRKDFPEFGLTGQLLAQGEDMEDRWALVMGDDGIARKQKIVITGQRVQCPECSHKFIIESSDNG